MRVLLALLLAASCASSRALAADAERGEVLYNSRCIACHSPDANRVGPMHRGLFGREAGAVPGFNYSNALSNARVVWDEQTLDQWLADPKAFLPSA
jgi:cytochrome c